MERFSMYRSVLLNGDGASIAYYKCSLSALTPAFYHFKTTMTEQTKVVVCGMSSAPHCFALMINILTVIVILSQTFWRETVNLSLGSHNVNATIEMCRA